MDRVYTLLLSHLHRPNSLPLPTIQASIAHYLAHIQPNPAPLAAAVVSSSYFQPLSHQKLQALCISFRHAVHAKSQLLHAEAYSLFVPSIGNRLKDWARGVITGLDGGHPIIRLACTSGLLLGLDDVNSRLPTGQRDIKGRFEDEVIVVVADVIDFCSFGRSSEAWEVEFQHPVQDGEVDALSLSLIIASQVLPCIPSEKVTALPLPLLSRMMMDVIISAFQSGNFLSSLHSANVPNSKYTIFIPNTAPLYRDVSSMLASPVMSNLGSISKTCARMLALFLDDRPQERSLEAASEALQSLDSMAEKIELAWSNTILSDVTDESMIAPDSRELTTSLWTIFKTFLFTTIMLSEGVLSSTIFISPALGHHPTTSESLVPLSSCQLALITLSTLSNLSFVISRFGGVSGSANSGFSELKKTFYIALDILSASADESERFVRKLNAASIVRDDQDTGPLNQAKNAFILACAEQLVPVLGTSTIRDVVFPLCLPHLFDPANRETYESAHSVVLAILSFSTKAGNEIPTRAVIRHENKRVEGITFAAQIVPFYTSCLIENSAEGRLSTIQLRLAFSVLVRSAYMNGSVRGDDDGHSLVWSVIETLLSTLFSASLQDDANRLHRLRLALISSVPSVPLALLPRVLDAVSENIIASTVANGRRQELVDALYAEILERVGDKVKEFTLRWWYNNRSRWQLPFAKEMSGGSSTPDEAELKLAEASATTVLAGVSSRL